MVPMALKICLSGDFYPVWNLASSSTSCSLYSILISRAENYVLNGVMAIGLDRLGRPVGEACTVCYRDTLMVYGGIRISLPYSVVCAGVIGRLHTNDAPQESDVVSVYPL